MKKDIYLMADKAMTHMCSSHAADKCQRLAIVGMEAEKFVTLGNTACAAGLRGMAGKGTADKLNGGDIGAIVSMAQMDYRKSDEDGEDHSEFFFDWLINRSPYAKCISTKSVKVALTRGIIYDADYPNNLIVGAITASRLAWEYKHVLLSMYNFVQAGMDETAAFYMAHNYAFKGDLIREVTLSCHLALASQYVTERGLSNFCHGLMPKAGEVYKTKHSYEFIQVLWGEYDKEQDMLRNIGVVNNDKLPNPFARGMIERINTHSLKGAANIKLVVEHVNKLAKVLYV